MLLVFIFRQQSSNSDNRWTAGQRGRHSGSRDHRTDPSSTTATWTHPGSRCKGKRFERKRHKRRYNRWFRNHSYTRQQEKSAMVVIH